MLTRFARRHGGAGFDLAASREALAIAVRPFAVEEGAAGRLQFLDVSGVPTSDIQIPPSMREEP